MGRRCQALIPDRLAVSREGGPWPAAGEFHRGAGRRFGRARPTRGERGAPAALCGHPCAAYPLLPAL